MIVETCHSVWTPKTSHGLNIPITTLEVNNKVQIPSSPGCISFLGPRVQGSSEIALIWDQVEINTPGSISSKCVQADYRDQCRTMRISLKFISRTKSITLAISQTRGNPPFVNLQARDYCFLEL